MKKSINSSENFMFKMIFISVFCTLLCVVMMCSMTYAWFSDSIESEQNIIQGSRFALSVTIIDENNAVVNSTNNVNGVYTFNFTEEGEYTITLEMTEDSTASKGYCQIIANAIDEYNTEVISKDGVQNITFKIKIENASIITFEPKLGISSNIGVTDDSVIIIKNISDN